MPVHEFKVEMTCEGCSNQVKKVLGKQGDKIQNVNIDLDKRLVQVTTDMSSDELLEIIKKTGKETSYVGEAK